MPREYPTIGVVDGCSINAIIQGRPQYPNSYIRVSDNKGNVYCIHKKEVLKWVHSKTWAVSRPMKNLYLTPLADSDPVDKYL